MQVNLIFTNDWELFGEGSGDFHEIQEKPLLEMLQVFSHHGAQLTVFAEIGQQWAHRQLGTPWATAIADRWQELTALCVREGHDVQLHIHPTWLNARHGNGRWHLDFSQWQLASLSSEKIEEVLRRGRATLEDHLRSVDPSYRCLAFRAGAFCIQPEAKTVPSLLRSGLTCDSSLVPGMTDHLFFDYRKARVEPGAYVANVNNLCEAAADGATGLLEFPIHTAKVWDSPVLRRLTPKGLIQKLQFGIEQDETFERWAKARDQRTKRIYPASSQPLIAERARALRHPKRWLGFLARRSVIALDYDFLAPQIFAQIVDQAVVMAKRSGQPELSLVALGHAKNIHSPENIDRIFIELKKRFGHNLSYKTLRQSVTDRLQPRGGPT